MLQPDTLARAVATLRAYANAPCKDDTCTIPHLELTMILDALELAVAANPEAATAASARLNQLRVLLDFGDV